MPAFTAFPLVVSVLLDMTLHRLPLDRSSDRPSRNAALRKWVDTHVGSKQVEAFEIINLNGMVNFNMHWLSCDSDSIPWLWHWPAPKFFRSRMVRDVVLQRSLS